MPEITQTIPDIERCALTILANDAEEAIHPVLRDWVRAVANDPNEQRRLEEFPIDPERQKPWCRLPDPDVPGRRTMRELIDGCNWIDTSDELAYRSPEFAYDYAKALLHLAADVVWFRRQGRPEGDQTNPIMGAGTPVAYRIPSLAASVAEYCQAVQRAWARRRRAERYSLDSVSDVLDAALAEIRYWDDPDPTGARWRLNGRDALAALRRLAAAVDAALLAAEESR
jgi:hypothetical protein